MVFKKGYRPWNKGRKTGSFRINYKHSNETKMKMAKARIGYKFSAETKQKISRALTGKKKSEEHIEKNRLGHLGQPAWNKGMYYRTSKKHPIKRFGGRKGKQIYVSHLSWMKANHLHRVPQGCLIHHIDGNPENNNIQNLQLMDKRFHNKLHHQVNLNRS